MKTVLQVHESMGEAIATARREGLVAFLRNGVPYSGQRSWLECCVGEVQVLEDMALASLCYGTYVVSCYISTEVT